MRYIEKDEALFELLKEGKIVLRDSSIRRINIFIEEIEGGEGWEGYCRGINLQHSNG
jgi:hypothetical protein